LIFKPAFMDDVLEIITTPIEVKRASITLLQQCRRGDDLPVARVRVALSPAEGTAHPKPLRLATGCLIANPLPARSTRA
jgi:acyl-CoA thioester hydrolase